VPVSLLAVQKFAALLLNEAALQSRITSIAQTAGISLPQIGTGQVVLSSASPALADNNVELTYPRVCLYTSAMKNSLMERFRSFSGTVSVVADIWASASLITDCDQWIHYYLEAVADILRENRGDWGDGVYFSGTYDAQILPPAAGGVGFVQVAKLTCLINVSQN
jgi:hypothetical protein